MVAGQPVLVQSPARKRLETAEVAEAGSGRQRSQPGAGENVALISFTTVAFSSLASRAAGRTSHSSRQQRSMISWRERSTRSYDALMTSWRYCSDSLLWGTACCTPTVLPYNLVLLKTHCVVRSSRARNGSSW